MAPTRRRFGPWTPGLLVALLALAGCAEEPTVILACSIDISDVVETIVLDPVEGTARMLPSGWNPTERTGTATVTDYRYELAFPPVPDRAELHYHVDRRTLQANRWFVNESENSYLDVEATCVTLDEEPVIEGVQP